jgi:hypothetical protein
MNRTPLCALLLTLAACGGEPAPQDTAAPAAEAQAAAPAQPAAQPDAPQYLETCTLVPAEAVAALLAPNGRNTTVEMAHSPGGGLCSYPLADYTSLALTATRLATPEAAANGLAYSREAMGQNVTVTPIPGMGDEAFEYGQAHIPEHVVNVRRGSLVLQARATKGERLPEIARALARLGLERIPAQ